MEVLKRARSSLHNLRTSGPVEDCSLFCYPHPMITSMGDTRISTVLQSSDMSDDVYLPVFGGCLVWTAVPSLGPQNHAEFCFLAHNGAIGDARMCSNFAVVHVTTPRTE